MAQTYETHAHHPVRTYFAAAFTLTAIICLVGAWLFGWPTLHLGVVSLSLGVAALVSISRAYIVRLQDRIILLEMKIRCAELLTPEQRVRIAPLQPRQLIALRFASDAELPELAERAIRDELTSDQIKRAVKNWRADNLRT